MSAVLQQEFSIRPMREDDLDMVMEIETQTYPFPWTRGIFQDCLHVGYCCWVFEYQNEIQAYGIMSIGGGEAHLLTIVVREEYQRQGLGRIMVQHLLDIARQHKSEMVLLEVRPSNSAAIQLYRALGFNEVGVRKDYYPAQDGREDALIMARAVYGVTQ